MAAGWRCAQPINLRQSTANKSERVGYEGNVWRYDVDSAARDERWNGDEIKETHSLWVAVTVVYFRLVILTASTKKGEDEKKKWRKISKMTIAYACELCAHIHIRTHDHTEWQVSARYVIVTRLFLLFNGIVLYCVESRTCHVRVLNRTCNAAESGREATRERVR